jgi:hypothetical protein
MRSTSTLLSTNFRLRKDLGKSSTLNQNDCVEESLFGWHLGRLGNGRPFFLRLRQVKKALGLAKLFLPVRRKYFTRWDKKNEKTDNLIIL